VQKKLETMWKKPKAGGRDWGNRGERELLKGIDRQDLTTQKKGGGKKKILILRKESKKKQLNSGGKQKACSILNESRSKKKSPGHYVVEVSRGGGKKT